AFRRAFDDAFGRKAVSGKTALVVGAGGAGRAVAFALFDLGVSVLLIHDRDADRAHRLVGDALAEFGPGRSQGVAHVPPALSAAAGFVNATPAGMLGVPGIPIPLSEIPAHLW